RACGSSGRHSCCLHDALPIANNGAHFDNRFEVRPIRYNCASQNLSCPDAAVTYVAMKLVWPTIDGLKTLDKAGALDPRVKKELRSEEHTSELQSRLELVCRLQ